MKKLTKSSQEVDQDNQDYKDYENIQDDHY